MSQLNIKKSLIETYESAVTTQIRLGNPKDANAVFPNTTSSILLSEKHPYVGSFGVEFQNYVPGSDLANINYLYTSGGNAKNKNLFQISSVRNANPESILSADYANVKSVVSTSIVYTDFIVANNMLIRGHLDVHDALAGTIDMGDMSQYDGYSAAGLTGAYYSVTTKGSTGPQGAAGATAASSVPGLA